jgi:hypothetical protein
MNRLEIVYENIYAPNIFERTRRAGREEERMRRRMAITAFTAVF